MLARKNAELMRKRKAAKQENGKLLSQWHAVSEWGVDSHGDVLRLRLGQRPCSLVLRVTYRRTNSGHDRDDVSFHDGNSNRGGRDDLGRGREPFRRTLDHIVAQLHRLQFAIRASDELEHELHLIERRNDLVGRRILVPRGPQWLSVHLG